MACDSPYYVKNPKYPHVPGALKQIPVPCGKCPVCRQRRVNQWTFRLEQEQRLSTAALFVTLTYDTENAPISPNGFMTLDKTHVQKFIKRLRANRRIKQDGKWIMPPGLRPIRYYAAGEYGGKRGRPHYHLILFNVEEHEIAKAWTFGIIDAQRPKSNSALAYTAKYIDKDQVDSRTGKHRRDDRAKEFSLMSKGLGKNYLTPAILNYHKSNPDKIYHVQLGGVRVPMSRYYREKLWDEKERQKQNKLVKEQYDLKMADQFGEYLKDNPDADFDDFIESQIRQRYHQAQNRRGKRNNC